MALLLALMTLLALFVRRSGATVVSDPNVHAFATPQESRAPTVPPAASTTPIRAADEGVPFDIAFHPIELSSMDTPALSPDGRFLAYSLFQQTYVPEGEGALHNIFKGTRLFLKNLGDSNVRDLAEGVEAAYAPSWSPDGRQLAYYVLEGERLSLDLYDVESGTSRRVVEGVVDDGLINASASWSPDGTQLVVLMPPDGASAIPEAPAGVTANPTDDSAAQVEVYRTDGQESMGDMVQLVMPPSALALVTVADGTVERLTDSASDTNTALAYFSPSGRWLLMQLNIRFEVTSGTPVFDLVAVRLADRKRFVLQSAVSMTDSMFSDLFWGWHPTQDRAFYFGQGDLYSLSLEGETPGEPMLLDDAGHVLRGTDYVFSQDGQTLYTAVMGETPVAPVQTLVGLSLTGAPPTILTLPDTLGLSALVRADRLRLWQPEGNTVTLIASDRAGHESKLVRFNLRTGLQETLLSRHGLFSAGMMRWTAAAPGSPLLTTYQDFATPPMIATLDDAAALLPVVVADSRAADYPVGSADFFETPYTDAEGTPQTLRTAVLLPPGWSRDTPAPAIAHLYGSADLSIQGLLYGGSATATIPTSILTSRGYAVLMLDAPLGPEGAVQDIRTALTALVLAQVQHAADLGYIDPNRVAVMGQSFGGYGTAALLTDTERFRAGVAVSGTYDLTNSYALLNGFGLYWTEQGQARMGATPWEARDRFIENSPFYSADRIQTPLLLVHGVQDELCLVSDAQKMFMALRRLGRPAELLIYPRGGHVITEWRYEDAVDVTERVLTFLEANLGAVQP